MTTINFEDIRVGDTIRYTSELDDNGVTITSTREGTVTDIWDGVIASCNGTTLCYVYSEGTVELLERLNPLPTETGATIQVGEVKYIRIGTGEWINLENGLEENEYYLFQKDFVVVGAPDKSKYRRLLDGLKDAKQGLIDRSNFRPVLPADVGFQSGVGHAINVLDDLLEEVK